MISTTMLMAGLALQASPTPVSPRDVLVDGRQPTVVLEITSGLRVPYAFSLYAPRGPLIWRKVAGHQGREQQVEWAEVEQCPGALDMLLELEDLPMPRVDVPRIGRDDQQGPPMDGVNYRLWFRGGTWPDGYAYDASVHSNMFTPLARWSDRFREVMQPCWSAVDPLARDQQ